MKHMQVNPFDTLYADANYGFGVSQQPDRELFPSAENIASAANTLPFVDRDHGFGGAVFASAVFASDVFASDTAGSVGNCVGFFCERASCRARAYRSPGR